MSYTAYWPMLMRVPSKLTVSDPYWYFVRTLLFGEGTNGSSSFTEHFGTAVTVNGTATYSNEQSLFGETTSIKITNNTSSYITTTIGNYIPTWMDFTIETWYYPTSNSDKNIVFMVGDNTGGSIKAHISGGVLCLNRIFSGSDIITGSTAPTLNTWNHIAIVRNNGIYSLYLNGVRLGTSASFNDEVGTNVGFPLRIGGSVDTSNTGSSYFTNLRYTLWVPRYSGASLTVPTAVFTTTPPNEESDPHWSNVILLLRTNPSTGSFEDYSNNNATISLQGTGSTPLAPFNYAGRSASIAQPAFYTKARQHPPSCNQVVRAATGLTLPADFTIEYWISAESDDVMFTSFSDTNLYWYNDSYRINGSTLNGETMFTRTTMQHVAVSRTGSTVKLFINGHERASATNSATQDFSTIEMGRFIPNDNLYLRSAYVGDLRITRGVGRYTSDFIVPNTLFPAG